MSGSEFSGDSLCAAISRSIADAGGGFPEACRDERGGFNRMFSCSESVLRSEEVSRSLGWGRGLDLGLRFDNAGREEPLLTGWSVSGSASGSGFGDSLWASSSRSMVGLRLRFRDVGCDESLALI